MYKEKIMILNMYMPNKTESKKHEAKLIYLKEKLDKSMVIVGDFNTLFSTTDRVSRGKKQQG